MKANELMIGDWVFVNDVEHLRPMQVGEIKRKSGTHYACLYDPNDVSEHCECVVDKVVGINLRQLVLKKNGFDYYNDHGAWMLKIGNAVIAARIAEDVTIVDLDAPMVLRVGVYNLPIKYLHEFQHLCTMCNIKIDWKA